MRTGAWTAGVGAQGEVGDPGGKMMGLPLLALGPVSWSVDTALASFLDREGPVLVWILGGCKKSKAGRWKQ